ncbi:MAG: DUF4399 domain-containing protein [Chitinophagales bacterium]
MHTSRFIPMALLVGLFGCGDGSEKTTTSTDTSKAAATQDTSMNNMKHDTVTANIQPVPEIPKGAKVFFVNLKDGQKVKSPLKVEMGVSGIKLDTAGPIVAGSGHHHLLIDAGDSLASGTVVPKDSTHLHFGKAQKEATVNLSPGKHKLTLQYADGIHRSYGAPLSATIYVVVQ